MSNVATTQMPSTFKRMTKAQLERSFYSLKLDSTQMTKPEMLAKIEPILTPKVIEKVKAGGEY